ncbi:MAG: hypothetical protein ABL984_11385 [Pyrinomonadaceae bacterium]
MLDLRLPFLICISIIFHLSCKDGDHQRGSAEANVREVSAEIIDPAISSPTHPVGYMTPCEKIDENNESEPFSFRSIQNNFREAHVVAFAEVVTMRPDNHEKGYRPYTFTARIKEVFKGGVRFNETVEYGYTFEVFDDEPQESDFLGGRVLWLHRRVANGQVLYGQMEFMASSVDCNILEKLRKISKNK